MDDPFPDSVCYLEKRQQTLLPSGLREAGGFQAFLYLLEMTEKILAALEGDTGGEDIDDGQVNDAR